MCKFRLTQVTNMGSGILSEIRSASKRSGVFHWKCLFKSSSEVCTYKLGGGIYDIRVLDFSVHYYWHPPWFIFFTPNLPVRKSCNYDIVLALAHVHVVITMFPPAFQSSRKAGVNASFQFSFFQIKFGIVIHLIDWFVLDNVQLNQVKL